MAIDPGPFLRGNPFPGDATTPYPRALPADASRLPGGTWAAATIPAGVRLAWQGDAAAVAVAYRTATGELGVRGDGAGRAFEVWSGDTCVAVVPAEVGEGVVELPSPGGVATAYLPEGMRPTITSLTAKGGSIAPAPEQPRWLAYGDSITEGWVASGPARSWPAVLARRLGLDVANLGYAGSARGELPSADHLAGLPAAVVTLAFGTNNWSTIPHTADLLAAVTRAFLAVVRQGHPTTPIVVLTPILRPAAETTPNRLGATLADLREAMAHAVQGLIDDGDGALTLVDGLALVEEAQLADGIHPGDEGHLAMAEQLAPIVGRVVGTDR